MSEERTNKSIYYLMLVTEDSFGNVIDRDVDDSEWEKLKQLSQEKKAMVLSDELVKKMILMQGRFRLDDMSVGKLNILIRKIFFGELSLAECEAKIGSMLMQTGGGDPNQARAIVEFIQKEILTIQLKPRAEETEAPAQAVTANLPLLQALSKYENLGNQLITEDRIRIKSQPDPVRPSLLYWLKYYRDELGVGHHDNVQRGGFLFRSENGKRLSAQERERINLILKSVEENFPLAIDTERQEIVFPAFQGVLMGEHPPRLGEAGREVPPVAPSPSQGTRPVGSAAFAPAEARPPAPTDYATGGLRIGRSAPSGVAVERAPRSAEIGSVNFSTTHVFPAEREAAENRAAIPQAQPQVPRPAPQFVPPPAPKRAVQQPNPFRIDPVSLGEQD